MGETRKIKTKVLFKHETATDWELSSYIPEVGEKVLYDPDKQYNYTRVKYGDGIHRVHDLPFSGSKADWLENDENSSGYIENRPFYEDENGVKKLDNKFLDLENNETIQEITKKVVNADYEQNDEKDLSYIRNRPFHENQIVEEKYTPADAIESVRINQNNVDALLVSTNPYDLDKLISLKMITRHDNIGIQEAILSKEDAKEVNEYGYSFSCQAAYVIVALHKDYRPSFIGEISVGILSQLPQAGIYITQQGGYGDNDSVLECTFVATGIKKLDNKFLDLQNNEDFKRVERLVATPDYSINSIDELGYIKNRPFYEDDEKQYTYTNNINSSNYITFKMQLGNTTYSNGKLFRVGDAFLTSQLMGAKVVTKYKKWTQVDNWTIQSSNIVEDTIDGTWLQFGTPTKDNVRYMFIVRDVSYKPSCITSTFTKTGIYMSLWSRSEYPYIDSISFSAKRMNPLEGRFVDLRGNDRYENLIERIDDLEEAIEAVPEQQQVDYADNNKASLTYIKNRPFYDKPELIVDIPFTMSGGYFQPDSDSQAYFVSDKTFTKDELLSKEFPFYFTITNYNNNTTQTLSVTEKNLYDIKEDGYIVIRVNAGNIDGMYRQAQALFVYDYTKCSFVWDQPTKNGIYFCDSPYYEVRFERLFRNGIKYLDNKYIDLKNHPDYSEGPDLTDYVKKTDYARDYQPGVVKTSPWTGFETLEDGAIKVIDAPEEYIRDRNKGSWYDAYQRPIKYGQLDLALKYGLTDNHINLTDTEKKSAHRWLFGSEPIDISYTESGEPIPLTFGNYGYIPYAYLQTEKVYLPNELIGATVEWMHDAGHHSTLTLSESMMADNTADGVTFDIGYKTYIFVAYSTNYKPNLTTTAFPKTGVYFSYYDDGDYYWVKKVTKESDGITYLDNKYLDLKNHPELDLALKHSLTNNHIGLTDTEQTSAQKWLGVPTDLDEFTDKILTDESLAKKYTAEDYPVGYGDDYFGLASTDILPIDELDYYTVTAHFDWWTNGETETVTYSLSDFDMSVKNYGYRFYKNDVKIYIVTDFTAFGNEFDISVTSNGLYFGKYRGSQLNVDIISVDRTPIKKIDSMYLDIPVAEYDTFGLVKARKVSSSWGYSDCVIFNGKLYCKDYSNEASGQFIGTCSTAEATTNKTVPNSYYNLTPDGIVAIKFNNAVPANSTLNINNKGAKNMYFRGARITANVIKAGDTATFIYNGSQYVLLSVDRWHEDIKALDTKIGGIEAALDGILTLQNTYLGGES